MDMYDKHSPWFGEHSLDMMKGIGPQPAYSQPSLCNAPREESLTEGVEHDKQIYANDCKYTVSAEGVPFFNRVDRLIDANVEHGKCLAS